MRVRPSRLTVRALAAIEPFIGGPMRAHYEAWGTPEACLRRISERSVGAPLVPRHVLTLATAHREPCRSVEAFDPLVIDGPFASE